jgi:hypothetical protein
MELDNTVHALDATIIELCLSVFGWVHFRSTQAAVKMHTPLDLRGSIPGFIHVSHGNWHDVHGLDPLVPEPDVIYLVIVATPILPACASCIWPAVSSSFAPDRTSRLIASIQRLQTEAQVFPATKPSSWMGFYTHRGYPEHCAVSASRTLSSFPGNWACGFRSMPALIAAT